MTTSPADDADYDRSGRFAIEADGWQIIDLGRMLYPGGPHALGVVTPDHPPFHVGWRFASLNATGEDNRVIISHIGAKLGGSSLPAMHFPPAVLTSLQDRLRAYAMRHAECLFGETITGADFTTDDPRAEIF